MTTETNGQTRRRLPRLSGATELMLIQDLAVGDRSYADLAEQYGYATEQGVNNFACKNRERIKAAAAGQVEAMADLWITRKHMRLAVYQGEVLRNLALIDDIQEECARTAEALDLPIPPSPESCASIARLQGIIFQAVRSAAEESGQLPTRTADESGRRRLRHVVEGLEEWGAPA